MTGVKVGPDSLLVPKFSGDLEVVKARYTGSFNEQGGGQRSPAATVAPDWLADLQPARRARGWPHHQPRTWSCTWAAT